MYPEIDLRLRINDIITDTEYLIHRWSIIYNFGVIENIKV